MSRCFAPGALVIVLALGLAGTVVRAEQPASIEDLLQKSLSDPNAPHPANFPNDLPGLALAGPIDPAIYLLGPGDRLVVQWSGRVTRAEYVDVGPAGDIFLSEVGGMNVAGQTLAAARSAILERLQRVTRDVRVDVQLARPRVFRVYVSGSVSDPGPVEALGGSRASDVVRPSGMLPGASRRNIRVQHRDGSAESADLERLLRMGDHSRDTWLRDGDVIVVPPAAEFVEVSGAVRSAGFFELASGDSAATLLRLAGGPLPAAAPDGVEWIHWATSAAPETLHTTLKELLAGKSDGPLALGDHLFLRYLPDYRITGKVTIRGEVARPGSYPVRLEGTRLSELVGAAGGLLSTADPRGIRVHRPRPAEVPLDSDLASKVQAAQRDMSVSEYGAFQAQLASRNEDFSVDWTTVLTNPGAHDLLLQNNDIVTVERLVPSIRIDGEVVHPGVLSYVTGKNLEEYVKQAGGFSARAWRGHEQVTRAGSSHTVIASSVHVLYPGDFIWVPIRPEDSYWRKSVALLTALAQIATIVIAIRSLR